MKHRSQDGCWWMACYVLVGFVQSGLLPIVLPLSSGPGPLAGLSYSAFAATGLAAPLIGAWSDKHRRHRLTLACGLGLAGAALLCMSFPGSLLLRAALAAVAGLGVASAVTVSTMFIVEVAPRLSWDRQIGNLQACIGSGQLAGLLAAGVLGLHHVELAFMLGAALLFLAVPLTLSLAPDPVVQVNRPSLPSRPARGGDAVVTGPQRGLHGLTRGGLARLWHSGPIWFLVVWLVSYTATNALSVMFAVAMVRDYGAPATLPTSAYAIGVGLSLFLYRLVGGWDARFGPWTVLSAGLAMRAIAIACIVGWVGLAPGTAMLPILVCFGASQFIWPLLSVSSNTLAVTLLPERKAEIVGLLNGVTAIGATLGGILGGTLLRTGFVSLCVAVLIGLLTALLLAWYPRVRLSSI